MALVNAGLEPTVPADDGNAGPLHVLDLPQLYSKPSAQSLLSALVLLAVAPSSWDVKSTQASRPASKLSEDGIPSYLTRIISSPLAWIPEHKDREEVWETASKRLAERSGRTAMPSVSRTFKIPLKWQDASETVDIKLHEPSLTGDNLGHKTWVASYLLAKRLPLLLPRLFPDIKTASEIDSLGSESSKNPQHDPIVPLLTRPRILELGAGTGLVGLAASALFASHTHLTDLPSILPNLQRNLVENGPRTLAASSTVTAAALDWSSDPDSSDSDSTHLLNNNNNHNPPPHNHSHHDFDLILAADSLYAPEHPTWLVRVMGERLKRDEARSARVLLELPLRSEVLPPPEHEELRERMRERGFVVMEEGEEVGFDDWVDLSEVGGQLEVRCWWSVWNTDSEIIQALEVALEVGQGLRGFGGED